MTSDNRHDDRRRVLYDAFKTMKRELVFSKPFNAKFSLKKEGFEILFEDSTLAHLTIHRVTRGYAAGEFGAYSNFSVWGGPPVALVRERLPDASSRFRQEKVIQGTSSSVVPGHLGDYKFLESVDASELAAELLEDIRCYTLPFVSAFADDYSAAIETLLAGDGIGRLNVRSPFVLSLAWLNLTGQMHLAVQLADVAAADERFYDYHESASEDPQLPARLIEAFR